MHEPLGVHISHSHQNLLHVDGCLVLVKSFEFRDFAPEGSPIIIICNQGVIFSVNVNFIQFKYMGMIKRPEDLILLKEPCLGPVPHSLHRSENIGEFVPGFVHPPKGTLPDGGRDYIILISDRAGLNLHHPVDIEGESLPGQGFGKFIVLVLGGGLLPLKKVSHLFIIDTFIKLYQPSHHYSLQNTTELPPVI